MNWKFLNLISWAGAQYEIFFIKNWKKKWSKIFWDSANRNWTHLRILHSAQVANFPKRFPATPKQD